MKSVDQLGLSALLWSTSTCDRWKLDTNLPPFNYKPTTLPTEPQLHKEE